jgi:predicted site-specific integrase-resolvase
MRPDLAGRRGGTMREFADSYGISRDSVKRLVKEGYLRTVLIGGRRIVPMSEFEKAEREGIGPGRKTPVRKGQL